MEFPVRINKYLARCGQGSRRQCDELIRSGKVTLNGLVLTDLANKVHKNDSVKVGGKKCEPQGHTVVFAYNKPKGVLCSSTSQGDKPTLYDRLPAKFNKLHYVGRLDLQSHGLLLLTNNGDLTQNLISPSTGIIRRYRVKVKPELSKVHKNKIEKGILIDKFIKTRPAQIFLKKGYFEIDLKEGKNREIRKMMEKFRYKVLDLQRISFGNVSLGELKSGKTRILSNSELNSLFSEKNPIKI